MRLKQKTLLLMFLFSAFFAFSANQDLKKGVPLTQVVKGTLKPVKGNGIKVPMITWGGDVATILAEQNGFFRNEGLDVSIFVENNFPEQVEKCLSGETPFLRGTMGMINAASEVFKREGTELVVIYQMTWSTGGDALVVRKNISKPSKLKDKTIALQLYGPHMDYLANILQSAGVSQKSINYKWFKELTFPVYDTKGIIVDPVSAFLDDDSIDGVMCIIPDALNLTSGGNVGTGSAGSVKDAKIMLSTKTASRIIADVYAVRKDYFDKNQGKVKSFVKALFKSQEELSSIRKNKSSRQGEYQNLMTKSADLLLGSPQAIPDVEGLLGDCEFVGLDGNIKFFTGKGTTRSMVRLTSEIQNSFKTMGLMGTSVSLAKTGWDYSNLDKSLVSVKKDNVEVRKFDTKKVIEKISVEPTSWAEEGTLFQIEINFAPNQSVFDEKEYADDFQKALEIAQTYGGSLIIVEGHSDPLGILKAKKKRIPSVEIAQMEQQAKNLSLIRSEAVRKSFLSFCKKKGVPVDESQFVAVGMGIASPKYNPPRTKEEWEANRRVVFRIKQVEAELSTFSPLE